MNIISKESPTVSTANAEGISLPQIVMSSTYSNWDDISLKSNYSQWEYVRSNIDGWLIHINRIGQEHPAKLSDIIFNGIINIIKENNIELYVESKSYYSDEGHGTDIKNIGYHDAQHNIRYLQRVYDAGYTVSAINFDGAFFDYTKLGLSNEEALNNIIVYYTTIHKKWPDIKLYMLFNFPNWGWKGEPAYRTDIPGNDMYMGDAYDVYNLVINGIKMAEVPLAGICVDNPYDYAVGIRNMSIAEKTCADIAGTDWIGRILELESMVHKDNLEFSFIFNSQRGGETDDSTYTSDTTNFINKYYERGGKPDICIMESWYKNPAKWLPENDNTTMTGCMKSAIEAIISNNK